MRRIVPVSPLERRLDVGDLGVAEEGADQAAVLLDQFHGFPHLLVPIRALLDRIALEHALEMTPDMLVGIQFGCIAREKLDRQPGRVLLDKAPRRCRDVGRVLVEHRMMCPRMS